jgi:hypothetical protein
VKIRPVAAGGMFGVINKPAKDGIEAARIEQNAWINGHFYFKHDLKVQKHNFVMEKKLVKAAKKGKTKKALEIYKEIVDDKKRQSAKVYNPEDPAKPIKYTMKVSKNEKNALGKTAENIVADINKNGSSRKMRDRLMLLVETLTVQGKHADVAAILLNMISPRQHKAKIKELKNFDAVISLARRAPMNRGRIIDGIRKAVINDPASMKGLIFAMNSSEIKEIFGGMGTDDVSSDLVSGMLPSEEGTMIQLFTVSNVIAVKEKVINEMYGITAAAYDELIILKGNVSANLARISTILNGANANKDTIIIRLIGLEHAQSLAGIIGGGH